MKRGEIYIIKRRDTVGSEIMKARPGVIVSNDVLNATGDVVEVVYLTTAPRKELPTHVCIHATGTPSTVLCEQIDSVSVRLIGERVGKCTDEEMDAIDQALFCSLGLYNPKEATKLSANERRLIDELQRIKEERDRYAKILDLMLTEADA